MNGYVENERVIFRNCKIEGHPTTHFLKSCKITFKQHYSYQPQPNNCFWTWKFWRKKMCSLFQASWAVSFSLEYVINTVILGFNYLILWVFQNRRKYSQARICAIRWTLFLYIKYFSSLYTPFGQGQYISLNKHFV